MEIIRQFTNTETKRSCISSHMYGVFWSIYASAEFCWSMKKVVNHIWHTSHGSATTLRRALNGMGITTFGSRIWKRNCDVLYKAENHHLKMIISLNPSCLHFFFQSRQGNGKTEWQSGNNSWTFFMNLNGMSPIRVRDCFRSAGIVSGCSWNGDLKKRGNGAHQFLLLRNKQHLALFKIRDYIAHSMEVCFVCLCEQKPLEEVL